MNLFQRFYYKLFPKKFKKFSEEERIALLFGDVLDTLVVPIRPKETAHSLSSGPITGPCGVLLCEAKPIVNKDCSITTGNTYAPFGTPAFCNIFNFILSEGTSMFAQGKDIRRYFDTARLIKV